MERKNSNNASVEQLILLVDPNFWQENLRYFNYRGTLLLGSGLGWNMGTGSTIRVWELFSGPQVGWGPIISTNNCGSQAVERYFHPIPCFNELVLASAFDIGGKKQSCWIEHEIRQFTIQFILIGLGFGTWRPARHQTHIYIYLSGSSDVLLYRVRRNWYSWFCKTLEDKIKASGLMLHINCHQFRWHFTVLGGREASLEWWGDMTWDSFLQCWH